MFLYWERGYSVYIYIYLASALYTPEDLLFPGITRPGHRAELTSNWVSASIHSKLQYRDKKMTTVPSPTWYKCGEMLTEHPARFQLIA